MIGLVPRIRSALTGERLFVSAIVITAVENLNYETRLFHVASCQLRQQTAFISEEQERYRADFMAVKRVEVNGMNEWYITSLAISEAWMLVTRTGCEIAKGRGVSTATFWFDQ
jgi:hypothetical protein